jgi:hypothetical protein
MYELSIFVEFSFSLGKLEHNKMIYSNDFKGA